MSIDITDDAAVAEEATRLKRQLEREMKLPEGACDIVEGDILRLLRWRDTGEDPGPLNSFQREILAGEYFERIYHRKIAQGELIFRSERDAEGRLRDYSFRKVRGGIWEKGALTARILKTGVIWRIMVKNTVTGETLERLPNA